MISTRPPKSFELEYLCIGNPHPVDELELNRHPVVRCLLKITMFNLSSKALMLASLSSYCLLEIAEVFPNLRHVHLKPPVPPLHNEVGIDLDCEVAVVNLQNLKVVQPNLDLCIMWQLLRRKSGFLESPLMVGLQGG